MDLVTATLMLHELTEEDRDAVLREVPRSSYGGGAGARLMLDPIVGDHICPTRHRMPWMSRLPAVMAGHGVGHAYERIHRMEIY